MSDRPINKSFDTVGDWHLPEAPDRIIAGSLCYTPQGSELHLSEAFRPLRSKIQWGEYQQPYSVIHGTTRDGEAMTLLNVQRVNMSLKFGSGGLRQPEKLFSAWLLIGGHVSTDHLYPEVSFRVPGLQVWLSPTAIEHSMEPSGKKDGTTFSWRVHSPPKKTMRIHPIETTLDWGIGWDSKGTNFTSIAVTVSGWVTVRPDTPKSIEWYMEQQGKIGTMLAFVAGTPMSPDCIEASIDDSPRKISVMVALSDPKYCSYTNLYEFYMPLAAMGIGMAEALNTWFKVYPKVATPSQLALDVLSSKNRWINVEFLLLMQALEGFHRGLFEGQYMPENQYESVKKALGDAIPANLASDHKDALRMRIRYGNQVSLRKRLRILSTRLSELIRIKIFGGKGKVPSQWVDTRDYYTHWDEDLRSNVLDGQGLYNANVRMKHFLSALFLDLMGIPQQAILKALDGSSRMSQHLLQLNAAERRGDE